MGGLAVFSMKGGGLSLSLPGKPTATIDLGQGVSNDTGLRGHLVVHWPDKSATYGLKIEPIDGRDNDGFSKAVNTTTQPVFINARLMDRDGTLLCTKQIELTQNVGKGAAAVAAGTDVFKRLPLKNGVIDGLWAEGSLPCTADQYKRADYWDFTTNFPTVAAQDKMMGRKPQVAESEPPPMPPQQNDTARVSALRAANDRLAAAATAAAAARRQPKKVQSLYFMQGDDQVTAYESGRALLTVGPGKSFFILRTADQAAAAQWAEDSALVHYTCDQHAVCMLRHSGSPAVVLARMNE
jgi:hypothetical protein